MPPLSCQFWCCFPQLRALGVAGPSAGPSSSAQPQHSGPSQQFDPLALPPDPSHLMDPFDQPQAQSSQLQPHQAQQQSSSFPPQPVPTSFPPQQQPSLAQQQSQHNSFPPAPNWNQSHGQAQHASHSQASKIQGFTHSHSLPTASGSNMQPEIVNVNIISPGIWTTVGNAQHSSNYQPGASSTHDAMSNASAPPLPPDVGSSSSLYSSSAPAAVQQPLAQQVRQHSVAAQQPTAEDNRRSVATNTQLTMQRAIAESRSGAVMMQRAVPEGRSGADGASQPPHQAVPAFRNTLPGHQAQSPNEDTLNRPRSLPPYPMPSQTYTEASASNGNGLMPQGNSQMHPGSSEAMFANVSGQMGIGRNSVGSRQMQEMPHSDSVGSLSSLQSMDGVERRSSGQIPMRAGSPALGGRVSSRPPTWSAQKHDPFGELVSQDIRSSSSRSIDKLSLQGPT